MGVPYFYKWLTKKYKLIKDDHCRRGTNQEIDYLYLDLNGILHVLFQEFHGVTEDPYWAEVYRYIDFLVYVAAPKYGVYLAFDGVAPRAKINQQRSRRYRSSQPPAGVVPESKSNSNCITPGTAFMDTLKDKIRFLIYKQVGSGAWKELTVYFSGCDVPGEGEHKLIDFMRYLRKVEPDQKVSHCIYGLDADLVMLALATHEPSFCILREKVGHDGRPIPITSTSMMSETNFEFLHLPVLKDYIHAEFEEFDVSRVIDDLLIVIAFVGNDYLPRLPHLNIRRGGLQKLMVHYRMHLQENNDAYLTEHGSIQWTNLDLYLNSLVKLEDQLARNDEYDEEPDTEGWRREYYASKLDIDIRTREGIVEVYELCRQYLSGIKWVFALYRSALASWTWYYPYHYAPAAKDLVSFLRNEVDFSPDLHIGTPLSPLEQLLCVLPPCDANLVPMKYRWFMNHESSPIMDLYPTDYEIDMEGFDAHFEGVVLLPFMDLRRVKEAVRGLDNGTIRPPEDVERVEEEDGSGGCGGRAVCHYYHQGHLNNYTWIESPVSSIFPGLACNNVLEVPFMVTWGAADPEPRRGEPAADYPRLGHDAHIACVDNNGAIMEVQLRGESKSFVLDSALLNEGYVIFGHPRKKVAQLRGIWIERVYYKLSNYKGETVYKISEEFPTATTLSLSSFCLSVEDSLTTVSIYDSSMVQTTVSTSKIMGDIHVSTGYTLHAERGKLYRVHLFDTYSIYHVPISLIWEYHQDRYLDVREVFAVDDRCIVTSPGPTKCLLGQVIKVGPSMDDVVISLGEHERAQTFNKEIQKDVRETISSYPKWTPLAHLSKTLKLPISSILAATSVCTSGARGTERHLGLGLWEFRGKTKVSCKINMTQMKGDLTLSEVAVSALQEYLDRWGAGLGLLFEQLKTLNENTKGPATYKPVDSRDIQRYVASSLISEIDSWVRSQPWHRYYLTVSRYNTLSTKQISDVSGYHTALRHRIVTKDKPGDATIRGARYFHPIKFRASGNLGSPLSLCTRVRVATSTHQIPDGAWGTVIGIIGNDEKYQKIEILLDLPYIAGSTLQGRCPSGQGVVLTTRDIVSLPDPHNKPRSPSHHNDSSGGGGGGGERGGGGGGGFKHTDRNRHNVPKEHARGKGKSPPTIRILRK